ncbi:hypothetical protein KZO25_10460 [Halomonas sp. ANAO-440]|uniref:hypothetical protein n=1 Tax=Halomonas sp. ANAO-440 TaxID=2861360 RepID=UPI001CAA58EE|nr:hypothetical protein [Halomonas sp. ANAO-440]MBZ0330734.1 hypothetical protein [Halomonas sp. ANAO-440]
MEESRVEDTKRLLKHRLYHDELPEEHEDPLTPFITGTAAGVSGAEGVDFPRQSGHATIS